MTTHFAGAIDLSHGDGARPTQDWAGMVRRAAAAMSQDPAHRVERVDLGRVFVAALSFSPHEDVVHRRPEGTFLVAGDPICCDEQDDTADLQTSVATLGEALLGERLSACRAARGAFAAMAWCPASGRLTLATDKLGLRPLYVWSGPDRAIFATTLRAVIEILGSRPAWDEKGLAQTIYFQQCFGDRTPYTGIRYLTGGTALNLSPGRPPESRRYFDLAAVTPREMAEDEIEAAVDAAFIRAVRRRSRAPIARAFLSGGLDSRLLVDALLGLGRTVETFSSSYPGSIDDVVAADAAAHLGTIHFRHHRDPAQRLRLGMDDYALYARQHFPPMRQPGPKAMWSGDGGSVTFGHVYMTEAAVEAAARPVSARTIEALFPALRSGTSRQLGRARARRFGELARESAVEELSRVAAARPDRRAFLFAMNNDQARHLHAHFESLHRSEVAFVTPFFDADFAGLIASLPIRPFLRHAMYNRVLQRFHPRSAAFFWQSYPGHVPSPHPPPPNAVSQWNHHWGSMKGARDETIRIAEEILEDEAVMADGIVNPWVLRLTMLLNRAGLARYNYEVEFARRIAQLYRVGG